MYDYLYTPLIVIHIFVCLVLISVVLLQRGKGADLGAAFGGSSQTVFGARGAESFLGKFTAVAAVVFMLTSISLAWLTSKRLHGSSLSKELATEEPAKPAALPPLPGTGSAPTAATPVAPAAPAAAPAAKAVAAPPAAPAAAPAKKGN